MEESDLAATGGGLQCSPESLEYIFNEESLMIGNLVLDQIHLYQTNFLIIMAFGLCTMALSGYYFFKFKQKKSKFITGFVFLIGLAAVGLGSYAWLLKFSEATVWKEDVELSKAQLEVLPKPSDAERKVCLKR